MDVRSFGKGFERYVERAEREYGVRYVRSSVSYVREDPRTHNLILRYVNEQEAGGRKQEAGGRRQEGGSRKEEGGRRQEAGGGRQEVELDGITRVETLEEAVEVAARLARPGDVVLLSPGGTSFDAFRDFTHRGDRFKELVQQLPGID